MRPSNGSAVQGLGRWRQPVLVLSLVAVTVTAAHQADAQLDRLRKRMPAPTGEDHVPMAAIPAGRFWMGVDGLHGLEDERPRHAVWLDAYAMDRFEVTTERYARFLDATRRAPPLFWDTVDLREHADRPVIGVSWHDADAYCRWVDKRLSTEAEWEKAARGEDERRYPWGNAAPTSALANFGLGARFSYSQTLMPVGRYAAGVSPYGIHDLAGNVWEWVSDWYGANYYESSPVRNPTGPAEGQFKVLRGGSWSELPKYLLTYGRFKLPPATQNSYTGFRCVKSLD